MTADKTISLNIIKPYNFALSMKAVRSFQPTQIDRDDHFRFAARIGSIPALIEVGPDQEAEGKLKVTFNPDVDHHKVTAIVEWVLFAELDLAPFYHLASTIPELAVIIRSLHGLKPMRPASLFEMAVIAITEQQISLAAAYRIRSRMVERFGEPLGTEWIFPEPHALANASPEDLRACGFSRQKAQYIQDLAGKITSGILNLNALKIMDDNLARETIMNLKGFGRWSADYILVRGLARPDCVPIDDLAIRSVVGKYLGNGQRATADDTAAILEPFRPYRGLLAFYLLAKHRLDPHDD